MHHDNHKAGYHAHIVQRNNSIIYIIGHDWIILINFAKLVTIINM